MGRQQLQSILVLVLACLVAGASGAAEPCPWKAKAFWHPTPEERSKLETLTQDLVVEPGDTVYGPGDSLYAVVQNDAKLHPYVYLRSSRTRKSELLVPELATGPRWSPDGKYIALLISKKQPGGGLYPYLAIVELASRREIVPAIPACFELRWAPDSKYLLASTRGSGDRGTRLYSVRPSDGYASVLDTTTQADTYFFDWSPDQKWIVATRPYGEEENGDVITSELWIFSRSGDTKCRILDDAGVAQLPPRWVETNKIYLRGFYHKTYLEREAMDEQLLIELIPPN